MTSVESTAGTARLAYETLEPLHVLAYFSPRLGDAHRDVGISLPAFYVGGRGGPLGDCAASVVASSFYNFAPQMIAESWAQARSAGLEKVAARRDQVLDDTLREILGDRLDGPEVGELAAGFAALATDLPFTGRPLAAAWAATEAPDAAHLKLWYAVAVLREWRGDNHIALLVQHGLDGIDAGVFHESELGDPSIRRRALGRVMFQLTRGLTEADWDASVDRLADRGLVERTDTGHALTDAGRDLYRTIEDDTDRLSQTPWAAPESADLLARTRPYVKTILDAGVLPGTGKKH